MQKKKEKRHVIVSASRVAITILSGMMIGLCAYVMIANFLAGNQMPMPFGVGAGVVLSGSMEPVLSVNDVIIVRRESSYHVGDIVVYDTGRSAVVHRVVAVSGSDITTKGDANNTADAPVTLSDISGRVVCSIPKAGVVVEFFRNPLGMLCVICLAVLMLELSFRGETKRGERDIERLRNEINELKARADANDKPDDSIN